MRDQDFYIVSYLLYGSGLPYRVSSDVVFRAVEVVDGLGLAGSSNPQLVAADPLGEIELSSSLIITTSTNQGAASKESGLDVYRVFAPGTFSFAADGKVSGRVEGALLVRSNESFSGKYFTTPIDLDNYSRQQFLDLILKSEGTPIESLDAFRSYLPSGWQRDPFAPDLLPLANEVVTSVAPGNGSRLSASLLVDRVVFGAASFGRPLPDRITGFDPSRDRLVLASSSLGPAAGSRLSVLPAVGPLLDGSRAQKAAHRKALKAQSKALKRLGRGGEPLIYNQVSGELIYDQNGSRRGFGMGGPFAIFEDRPLLSAANIEFM